MSRDIPSDFLATLDDAVVYPFFAVELLFDGDETLRLWTGQRVLRYDGNDWYGSANLLAIDTIEETSEISAKGATLTLSGVPSEVLSLALSEPYQGRRAKIYMGMFLSDASYAVSGFSPALLLDFVTDTYEVADFSVETPGTTTMANMVEVFSGYMDQMNIEETGETSTVELSIENKLLSLEKPRIARYTSAYQKSLYSGDKGLDFVEDLQDKEIVWGRKVNG